MKERPFDYRLTVTVPNDGRLYKAVLPLTDGGFVGDWPFELRALSFPRPYNSDFGYYPPYATKIQLRTPDDGVFDQSPIPISTLDPSQNADNLGGGGRLVYWRPFYPSCVWPARGTFVADLYNSSAAAETVTIVFHGVHYVPDDLNTGAVLPARFSRDYFDYITVTRFSSFEQAINDEVLRIQGDADFALCGITSAYRFPTFGMGRMLDENGTEVEWTSVLAGPIIYTITSAQDSPDAAIHITVVGNDVTVSYPALAIGDDLVAAWNAYAPAAALMVAAPGNAHLSPLVAGIWTVGPGSANMPPVQMSIRFKDQAGRRYSNALIDIRDQCAVIETPALPRWFWPPIIIPRNGSMLFDLLREDTAAIQFLTTPIGDLYLRWIGFKIRPVC